ENAFNACLKVTGKHPFIDLRVGLVSGSMVIIMKNSTSMPPAKDPLTMAELQREKENGRKCLGLQSIQTIVDAHHGYVEYHCNGGIFTTKISIICVRK
ncbi:MAG: GHKL domain-containing protein, partial [Eubacterium sp.]